MNTTDTIKKIDLVEIRRAVADYMQSEGCECCEDREEHDIHRKRLAELLDVPASDKEFRGFNFDRFSSKPIRNYEKDSG